MDIKQWITALKTSRMSIEISKEHIKELEKLSEEPDALSQNPSVLIKFMIE